MSSPRIDFTVLRSSRRSRARLGRIVTPHGVIETPAMLPVATQATVKALTVEQVETTKTQALIANTFHLHLKPGERVIARHGGIHRFMNWRRPLMTDSGGFQVFSLGFGRDLNVGKILHDERYRKTLSVKRGAQPSTVRIAESGVTFRSPLDGRPVSLSPEISIRIQETIGADIMFAFDELPAPVATAAYLRSSMERTHRWAERSLAARTGRQALFGIIQGGHVKALRRASARFIGQLPFDGFGIGGELGENKPAMTRMLRWVVDDLPRGRPRHLLGTGHLEDIPNIVRAGVDTFDCIVPTHYARHGTAFTSRGRLDVTKSALRNDRKPLDAKCGCAVCHQYTRSYIVHLFKAKEITGMVLVTMHNLWFFNSLVERFRADIRAGRV